MGIGKIFNDLSGGTDLKKAKKKVKERETENIKNAEAQRAEVKAQDARVQGQLDTDLAGQKNALAAANTQQQSALRGANTQQQGVLQQAGDQAQGVLGADLTTQHGLYDPQTDYGNGGIPLMEGAFGEAGTEGNQAFMDRFTASPLYQATYKAAMDEALRGTTFAGSAGSGVNNGGVLRELTDRGGQIGRNTIQSYLAQLQDRLNYGRGATDAASSAYGQNAGNRASAYQQTGSNRAGAWGDYGARSSGAWGDMGANTATAYGQNATNNLTRNNQLLAASGDTYTAQRGANSNIGAAQAAANTGIGQNKAGFWSGSAKLAGDLAPKKISLT